MTPTGQFTSDSRGPGSERPPIAQAREHADERDEHWYRALFDRIDQGFCVIEVLFDENNEAIDYRFLEVNAAFEKQTGIAGAAGKRIREIAPEHEAHWFRRYGDVALTGKAVRFEERARELQRWYDVYAFRIDPAKRHQVAVLFNDITARKRNERNTAFLSEIDREFARLSDPHEILHAAAEGIVRYLGARGVAFSEIDDTGTCVSVIHERQDCNVESVLGIHRLSDFLSDAYIADLNAGAPVVIADIELDPATAQRAAIYTRYRVRALVQMPYLSGGKWKFLLSALHNEVRAWLPDEVAVLRQVSERTWVRLERARAEAALRESNERFALITRATNDAVWDWDVATDKLWWNEGIEKLFGYPIGRVPLQINWWHEHVHPDDRAAVIESIERVIESGGSEWSAEYRFRLNDGGYAYIADRGFLVRDSGGKPLRMLGGMTDISERKAAEEALREADRRKDQFLAVLAHELRNPLAPIRQAAAIARSPKATPAQIEWSHRVIERQAQHMMLLLDDLLEISRITSGKLTLRKQPLTLDSVIDAAVESARPLIESSRHILEIGLPCERIPLYGDPLRLAQVFSNLLTNAAKYSEPGGTIRIAANCHATDVVVQVIDTGIGIPAESIGRLFEMFSQVQSTIDRASGGLGIGLALSKGLVELHGGTIGVHSEGVGRGATFTVSLPVRDTREPAAPPATESSPPPRRRRVLVVDDNEDAAQSVAMLLGLEGHDVRTAHDGFEAIRLAATFRPDIALLDIGMPKLNGYEVAQRLRREPWGRQIMLVATTGWGQREDRERALAAGFDRHLTKPADPDVLRELISAA